MQAWAALLIIVPLFGAPLAVNSQGWEIASLVTALASSAASSIQAGLSNPNQGIHIRVPAMNPPGCLDASCCFTTFDHLYANPNCPGGSGSLKWYFDGPKLVALRSSPACLDCWDGVPDCNVEANVCYGNPQQQWRVTIAKEQVTVRKDPADGRCITDVLFSLRNIKLGDDYCMTRTTNNFGPNHFQMKRCDNPPSVDQSFAIDRDWLSDIRRLQESEPQWSKVC